MLATIHDGFHARGVLLDDEIGNTSVRKLLYEMMDDIWKITHIKEERLGAPL